MRRTRPVPRLKHTSPSTQRRNRIRTPCDLDIHVRPMGKGGNYFWTTRVWDISGSGLSFHLKEEIATGTFLEVLVVRSKRVSRKLMVCVAHATEHSPDSWIIGCVLETNLNAQDLAALTAD